MAHLQQGAGHSAMARLSRRACTSSASLWTNPAASATLPVYEDVTLEWDPTCVSITSATVDLYLSVEQAASNEWQAVHEWTSVPYSPGKLDTQIKPTWWNASTGAGSVKAQFSLVPSGQPSWNTPAPAGPAFTIAYNGSYPSVTQTNGTFSASGPSVESAADSNKTSGLSGGKLAAAVAVPLAVVAIAVLAYVAWNRSRKRPERKRFSAVVDHRMSMISQGTWQPSHRPSGSHYTAGNRQSYFADPAAAANRHSTYSTTGSAVGVPSPLRNGVRVPPPAEMRQTGHGERASRISFAVDDDYGVPGRPSFSSHRRPGSIQTRNSMYNSQPRHSIHLSHGGSVGGGPGHDFAPTSTSPQHSPELSQSGSSTGSLAAMAQEENYFSRSSTREELTAAASKGSPARNFSPRHGHQQSFSSSLRNEVSASDRADSATYSAVRVPAHAHTGSHSSATATGSPSQPSRLRPMLLSLDTSSTQASSSSMPLPFRSSQILSPDEALASYARVTSPSGPPSPNLGAAPTSSFGGMHGAELVRVPTDSQARGAAKGGLSGLFGKSKGMLRSWTGGSIASVLQPGGSRKGESSGAAAHTDKDDEKARDGAKSPFEDPVEGIDAYDEKASESSGSPRFRAL